MFAVVGVVGGLILVGGLVWLIYMAGNRGRGQGSADRATMEREQHTAPKQPERTEGRGDL